MNLFSKRNFVILLAGVLVVAFGIMSLYLNDKKSAQKEVQMQQSSAEPTLSKSDDLKAIQDDLNNTEVENIDKDLQDMDKEINTSF